MTRPGKRMSWVSWVRLERAGEREPARPGESERPVPSDRMVTRSLKPQVTPVNEEQGSGAVKSQVEKNLEPGMSVRLSLMADSAAKSTALILGRC